MGKCGGGAPAPPGGSAPPAGASPLRAGRQHRTAAEILDEVKLASSAVVGMRFETTEGLPERSGLLISSFIREDRLIRGIFELVDVYRLLVEF